MISSTFFYILQSKATVMILRRALCSLCSASLLVTLSYCDEAPTEDQDSTTEKQPNIVFILADDLGYGDLGAYGATQIKTPHMDQLADEGMRFTNAYSPHSVCTPTRYSLMTGRYAWRSWNGHITVWANDPLLIDTARLTLPKLLKRDGYKTALIGKWHLGFGSPDTPGWDAVRGPDYNRALTPGPLEVGFDYFYGIPHVAQKPHVYIENHHVVGLSEDDSMAIVLDERWLNRTNYLQRIGVPRHQFIGNESARYTHDDMAMHITEKAVEYIEAQNEDEPFFLYFAHRNVHGPLRPNERFQGSSEVGVYGDFVHELDWSVGEVLKALDSMGIAENTIVFLSSDNGGVKNYLDSRKVDFNGHFINGPLFGQKTEAYEGGTRVPLLVRWPGVIKVGSQSGQIVALTDMLATMAEFTEQTIDWDVGEDSFSFLHVLEGRPSRQQVRDHVVVDATSGLMGIRKGSWKLITGQGGGGVNWNEDENYRILTHEWNHPDDPDHPPGQLYHLEDDIGETENLYYSNPQKVVELQALLRDIKYGGRSR